MKRDKYLCVVCRRLESRLNNKDLSVHHIQPLKTNWDQRMDDDNLITLCRCHHELAEEGQLRAELLKELVQGIPPGGSGGYFSGRKSNDAPL